MLVILFTVEEHSFRGNQFLLRLPLDMLTEGSSLGVCSMWLPRTLDKSIMVGFGAMLSKVNNDRTLLSA